MSSNKAGTAITITDTVYTTTNDGYLVLKSTSSGGYVNISVIDPSDTSIGGMKAHYAGDGNDYKMLFIRKGLKLKMASHLGTYSAVFVPLIS